MMATKNVWGEDVGGMGKSLDYLAREFKMVVSGPNRLKDEQKAEYIRAFRKYVPSLTGNPNELPVVREVLGERLHQKEIVALVDYMEKLDEKNAVYNPMPLRKEDQSMYG